KQASRNVRSTLRNFLFVVLAVAALAMVGSLGFAIVKAVKTPVPLATLHGLRFPVFALAFSPDGRTLVTAGGFLDEGSELRLWDVDSQQQRASLEGHRGSVDAVAFDPTGRILVTAGRDETVRLRDVASAHVQRTLRCHRGAG